MEDISMILDDQAEQPKYLIMSGQLGIATAEEESEVQILKDQLLKFKKDEYLKSLRVKLHEHRNTGDITQKQFEWKLRETKELEDN